MKEEKIKQCLNHRLEQRGIDEYICIKCGKWFESESE
jgi:hypothetical protein